MAKKETVFMRPGPVRDRFNDPVGNPAAWWEIPGATCVPRSSTEDEQRGPIVLSGFMVALNNPIRDVLGQVVPIKDDWELQIRGDVHQIIGAVGDFGRKVILYTLRASW